MSESLTLSEIIQVLDIEIRWCEQHPDKAFHAEYRKGFVNGLIQAKYLIAKCDQRITGRQKGSES